MQLHGLHWHTDLQAAITKARAFKRPILSLRLLGRLPDELTCANSRFFKQILYPHRQINEVLREQFILHWQSVRPVPIVTIDFGDGRRIRKTLTGNSVHVILDPDGRPVDALPGLFSPEVFLALLVRSHGYALADRSKLPELHRQALAQPVPPAAESRAMRASMIAPTKHMVELPMLRAVAPLADVEGDTRTNLALHARVHQAFASGAEWSNVDAMVARIYEDLFAMPLGDPALGLDIPDPFAAA